MSKKRIIFKQKIIMHTNNSNKKIYIKIRIKEIIVWILKNLMSAVFFFSGSRILFSMQQQWYNSNRQLNKHQRGEY